MPTKETGPTEDSWFSTKLREKLYRHAFSFLKELILIPSLGTYLRFLFKYEVKLMQFNLKNSTGSQQIIISCYHLDNFHLVS